MRHRRRIAGACAASARAAALGWVSALALALPATLLLGGCGREETARAASNEGGGGAGAGGQGRGGGGEPRPVSVDLVLAEQGSLRPDVEYTGTTQPVSEVLLRSRVEGRILALNADVGDRVKQGQIIARFDPDLLLAGLNQARAELAARQSEVAQAQTLVTDAQARVQQARQDYQQKEADAERYAYLAKQGAWPRQQAEQARTNAEIARQTIVTAEQQVKNSRRTVQAAQARMVAQQAVVRQQQEQLGFTVLRSPIDGVVLERRTEAGNLTQPGGEVLRIGAFDAVDVTVQVSELDLSPVRVGKQVRVRLDALPGREITGVITRVSSAADPVARLVPVQVRIRNVEGRVGAGLLARVQFTEEARDRVLIPEGALQVADIGRGGGPGGGGTSGGQGPGGGAGATGTAASSAMPPGAAGQAGGAGGTQQQRQQRPGTDPAGEPDAAATITADRFGREEAEAVVFVAVEEGPQQGRGGGEGGSNIRVEQRRVRVGARADGQVEVLEGLEPGEHVVARAAQPLKGGEEVRPSAISEGVERPGGGSQQGQGGGGRQGGRRGEGGR